MVSDLKSFSKGFASGIQLPRFCSNGMYIILTWGFAAQIGHQLDDSITHMVIFSNIPMGYSNIRLEYAFKDWNIIGYSENSYSGYYDPIEKRQQTLEEVLSSLDGDFQDYTGTTKFEVTSFYEDKKFAGKSVVIRPKDTNDIICNFRTLDNLNPGIPTVPTNYNIIDPDNPQQSHISTWYHYILTNKGPFICVGDPFTSSDNYKYMRDYWTKRVYI